MLICAASHRLGQADSLSGDEEPVTWAAGPALGSLFFVSCAIDELFARRAEPRQ
jgi:hypothetical protein